MAALHQATARPAPRRSRLQLQCSDGRLFDVTHEEAMMSSTLWMLLQDIIDKKAKAMAKQHTIPIFDVPSESVELALYYCRCLYKHQVEENDLPLQEWNKKFVELDSKTLCDLAKVASHLDIQPLVDLTCRSIAQIMSATEAAHEIRQKFGLDDPPEGVECGCELRNGMAGIDFDMFNALDHDLCTDEYELVEFDQPSVDELVNFINGDSTTNPNAGPPSSKGSRKSCPHGPSSQNDCTDCDPSAPGSSKKKKKKKKKKKTSVTSESDATTAATTSIKNLEQVPLALDTPELAETYVSTLGHMKEHIADLVNLTPLDQLLKLMQITGISTIDELKKEMEARMNAKLAERCAKLSAQLHELTQQGKFMSAAMDGVDNNDPDGRCHAHKGRKQGSQLKQPTAADMERQQEQLKQKMLEVADQMAELARMSGGTSPRTLKKEIEGAKKSAIAVEKLNMDEKMQLAKENPSAIFQESKFEDEDDEEIEEEVMLFRLALEEAHMESKQARQEKIKPRVKFAPQDVFRSSASIDRRHSRTLLTPSS
ncbi:TPA: hypothetical protein N0F65_003109 [Lagenidium giganteum]|uniref:SKP1 component dimerisation domain-containing protein n=1 Tax=Lagenidium giganteum TaxID=4803 RepID=A0AAV2YY57_9STRA|nr:TPA: hypothetical protein N0F65_003109 [Lagenidium giganteum]